MQAPFKDRNGKYEEQEVPDRLVERFRAKGWKVIIEQEEQKPTHPTRKETTHQKQRSTSKKERA